MTYSTFSALRQISLELAIGVTVGKIPNLLSSRYQKTGIPLTSIQPKTRRTPKTRTILRRKNLKMILRIQCPVAAIQILRVDLSVLEPAQVLLARQTRIQVVPAIAVIRWFNDFITHPILCWVMLSNSIPCRPKIASLMSASNRDLPSIGNRVWSNVLRHRFGISTLTINLLSDTNLN